MNLGYLKIEKRAVVSVVIACMYTLLTVQTDNLIFTDYVMGKRYFAYKMMLCVLLYIIIRGGLYVCQQYRAGNVKYRVWVHWSLLYFSIMAVFMLLVWPGLWQYDDIQMLSLAKTFELFAWHHFITSVFFIISMMLLPFPAGIVIVQILVISAIVGYIIATIQEDFFSFSKLNKKHKWIRWLLFVPFFLPPVVAHNLFPFRSVLYTYLELLLVCELICIFSGKRRLNFLQIVFIALLGILAASWRSEGIYYVVLVPMLLVILSKIQKNSIKTVIALVFGGIIILGTVSINYINDSLMGGGTSYKVTGMLSPVVEVIKTADLDEIEDIRDDLDAVLDISVIKDNPNVLPPVLLAQYNVLKNYTDEEYNAFKIAYLKLIIRYPIEFVKTRFDLFLRTAGIDQINSNQRGVFRNSYKMFVTENGEGKWLFYDEFLSSGLATRPLSQDIRQETILTLCALEDLDGFNTVQKDSIFWNLVIPFILAIIGVVWLLIKRIILSE